MISTTVSRTLQGDRVLDSVLYTIHTQWIANARRILEPVLETGADHWARWGAVRYLADEFQAQLQSERALVDELRPFLDPQSALRLKQEGERVSLLRLELDRIGRRRGTSAEFADGALALLGQLGVWCTEIERATHRITPDMLPPEAVALLGHLDAISELRQWR